MSDYDLVGFLPIRSLHSIRDYTISFPPIAIKANLVFLEDLGED